jgi:8-oxo-dGTP pyrophosphatase MutT (NUDIX family)
MPAALKTVHLGARVLRPVTLGVRAMILDDQQRVFLVRHSYVPGWQLPGGGVEPGETAVQALIREVAEEAAIAVRGKPALHGVFFNRRISRRDHVLLFVVRDFHVSGPRTPDWEIIESRFFAVDALPPETTRATRARLDEVLHSAPVAVDW